MTSKKFCYIFNRKKSNKIEFLIIIHNKLSRYDYEKIIKIIKKLINAKNNYNYVTISIECCNNNKDYLFNCIENLISKSLIYGDINFKKEVNITYSNTIKIKLL